MPHFLTLDDVLETHTFQIETYGGSAGVRDLGLLESALAQPESGFGDQYLHDGIFEMASAYLYHIVMNHPFTVVVQIDYDASCDKVATNIG